MESFYHQIESIASKYETDNIFIVGKGHSIDEVELGLCEDSLIITLNDSGNIIGGDICIFHNEWVWESLQQSGVHSDLYISDKKLPSSVCSIQTDFIPFTQKNADLLIHRILNDDNLSVEGILYFTAMKVCWMIANLKACAQTVYMIGFDFSNPYSKDITLDHSGDDLDIKSYVLGSQENYFNSMIQYFENNDLIHLRHVGNKSYSYLTTYELNQLFRRHWSQIHAMDADHVLVVAEFTNNHRGDLTVLKEMIWLAKEAGADLIKVQKRDIDSFYTEEELKSYYYSPFGNTLEAYRRGTELGEEEFDILDKECQKLGISWFASVLDYTSFKFIQQYCPKLIKIPSTISNHKNYHAKLANAFKESIVVSTGWTDPSYEDYIIQAFSENKAIYLLQCTSAYPTLPQDCQIGVVRHYKELSLQNSKIIPGYSSHDIGSLGCMLAVAAGAKVIEKHVKLGDTSWIHFNEVAVDLTNGDFKKFVEDIRQAEKMCGKETKEVKQSERHKYQTFDNCN